MDNITARDVVEFIWSAKCTPDDRSRIVAALNGKRKTDQVRASGQFRRGDRVQWESTHLGRVATGVVTKVNRMTIEVKEDKVFTTWRVSPTLLSREVKAA